MKRHGKKLSLFKRLKRAVTIEYVLVMMTLVTAFVAVILTSVTVMNTSAADYRDYFTEKRFLDDVGATYIAAQGVSGCLNDLQDGEHSFEYSTTYLVVRKGGTVQLHIELADADGDGTREAVVYRYGA